MKKPFFKSRRNILFGEIDAEIDDELFRIICSEIETAIDQWEKIRIVLYMRHYPSINSAEELYDNMRFLRLYSDRIEKVAVICDNALKETWVGLFALFSGMIIDFFLTTEMDDASLWISQ